MPNSTRTPLLQHPTPTGHHQQELANMPGVHVGNPDRAGSVKLSVDLAGLSAALTNAVVKHH